MRAEATIAQLELEQRATILMPDDDWFRRQMSEMAGLLKSEMASVAHQLRPMLGKIVAEPVVIPGKRLGYVRLRFSFSGWAMLGHVLGDKIPATMTADLFERASELRGESEEFVVDLGGPTQLDHWSKQIVAWRREGVTWKSIMQRTGLCLSSVRVANQRGLNVERAA